MAPTPARALFLDRDGTLIIDVGYPRDPAKVELLPGVATALLELSRQFHLIVVSNQSGVARGLIAPDDARAVDTQFQYLFGQEGVTFSRVEYCFHSPEQHCACRKPQPQMLRRSAHALGLALDGCVMVGDRESDIEAGRAAGCYTIAYRNESAPKLGAHYTSDSWSSIADFLLETWR